MKALLAALILCDARWVIRYTFGVSARFPLFPQKPTFTCTALSVAMGHSRRGENVTPSWKCPEPAPVVESRANP